MARHKLKRFAELETFPNYYDQDQSMKGKWSAHFFKNNHPLILELGCGKGEFSLGLGKEFQDLNFIGIDLKAVRLWRGAKDAMDADLSNVAFLKANIYDIEEYFAKNEVDEIWIPFPDPYPKPSKWKKRLVSSNYLNKYKNILKKEGIIHFKTDNTGLYEFACETLEQMNCKILDNTDDLYQSDIQNKYNSIPSYFESLFMEKGEKIKYIRFILP